MSQLLTDKLNNDVLVEKRVYQEESLLLFKAVPTAIVGTIIGILFVLYTLRDVSIRHVLLSWAAIFLLLTLVRYIHYRLFSKSKTIEKKLHSWVAQYNLLALAAALMWASVSVFLFPEESNQQLILAFVLATTCAVASSNIATKRKLVVTYITFVMIPLAVRFYFSDTDIASIGTFMAIVAMLIFIVSAMNINRTINKSIRNHIQADEATRKLNRSAQKLELHIKHTPLGVIEWDVDLNVTDWNDAAEKIFGYSRSEIVGKNAMQTIVQERTQEDVSTVHSGLRNQDGGLYSVNENVRKDGTMILCEWFNTPLINEDGDVIGIASLVHDVTERVRLEKMKNDFISTVSHELRTPLTSLRGTLGILQGNMVDKLPDEVNQLLSIASRNAFRLNKLIDDVLLIQQLESGKYSLSEKHEQLVLLLAESIVNNNGYARQKNIEIKFVNMSHNDLVLVDASRIMQVMDNLLSNAIKFSGDNSTIEVVLSDNNHLARVEVIDHGVGVDEKFVPKLFSRFTQFDSSTSRGFSGTGLGLSIAKEIIQLSGGEIGYLAAVGGGSCFYFTLPLETTVI